MNNKEKIKGWTTIEQSKVLLEEGLDPNTADMYYYKDQLCLIYEDLNYSDIFELFDTDGVSSNLTPCWSLGALSELVPDEPLFTKSEGTWTATINRDEEHLDQFSEKTLVGTLYEAIKWLIENNYIKKG